MKTAVRFILGLSLSGAAGAAEAATFTVTNTSPSGAGSLAQAVADANAAAGADTIAFNVTGTGCDGFGVCTIALGGTLLVTGPVTIDGYTQPGSAVNTILTGPINAVLTIVLSAEDIVGAEAIDLGTGAAGSIVRGVVISGGFQNTIRVGAA